MGQQSQIFLLVLSLVTFSLSLITYASPPGPVVHCRTGTADCRVTNAYATFPDRSACQAAAVAYPCTEHELLLTVSAAACKGQHMKVVTAYAHSIPKLSCPGGPSGAGLLISSERLNKVVSVDAARSRMTVEAGIKLRELLDAAAAHGLALPHSPYWLGITLGGLLGTGAHGSSFVGLGSAVHEYVVGMRLVVPARTLVNGYYAKIVDLKRSDPDILAAKVHLGVLGVVSQITLQLEPMFKRSITYKVQEDEGLEHKIVDFAKNTHYGDVSWYPSKGQAIYRYDYKVAASTPGEGVNDYVAFRLQNASVLLANRDLENKAEMTGNASLKCSAPKDQLMIGVAMGWGLKSKNNGKFEGYPVIGYQSDMQASGSCLTGPEDNLKTACSWDPRIHAYFAHQTTASIPFSNITSFLADVKKLRETNTAALCAIDLYFGFVIRFMKKSTAYLGKIEDSVDIDMSYYRSRDPNKPRLNEDMMEEIEQMMLFKYNGLPHLGKNRNVGFIGLREKLGVRMDKFMDVMQRFDEGGLFSSDWSDAVLGLRGKQPAIVKKGCALDGLCICSADEHCAPDEGYLCRPGLVYEKARVCRKVG